MPHILEACKVIDTVVRLRDRIRERFPDSSLAKVCEQVLEVSRASSVTADLIARPHWPLRIGIGAVVAAIVGAAMYFTLMLKVSTKLVELGEFVQFMESGINDLIFVGAAIFFLFTVERRIKRDRALKALHELRSLAHIIDMHQLTKDPERLAQKGPDTKSSPKRTLSPFELSRYLDYCSELLSLIAKIAALYAQRFDDPVALTAVDEVESLTSGISRKVWQKMMILNT